MDCKLGVVGICGSSGGTTHKFGVVGIWGWCSDGLIELLTSFCSISTCTLLRMVVRLRDSGRLTPSITFRHLPPNSARFGYATDRALFISAQLSTNMVSTLQKVRVLI